MKHLDSPIERIHHEDAIVVIDKQPRRRLKIAEAGTLPPEVIKQLPLLIEHLDEARQSLHDIDMAFRVHAHSLGPEHVPVAVAQLSDGVLKLAGAVHYLDAKVHRIHHHQVLADQPQLSWKIKLPFTAAILANRLQYASLHVKDENLIAQRVSDINPLLLGIHRDPRRALIESLAALNTPDHPPQLAIGIEDKDFPRLRVGHVDVVLLIHRDALRRAQRVLPLGMRYELILLLRKIEDMNPHGARIGNDDAIMRIRHHAVGPFHVMPLRRTRHNVHKFGPEAAFDSGVALRTEAAL